MAAAVGACASTIRAWENAHTEPDLRKIPAVIRFLGLDPRSLPSALADQIRHSCRDRGPSTHASSRGIDTEPTRVQDRSLGPRLRAARRAHGLSIQDLAQRFQVDPTTISRWEHGQSTPFARFVPGILELVDEVQVPDCAPLGNRIRAYRRRHGLTQQDLADRLGIHQGALSDW
ncbi:MAG TPA: helix-turn-helix domain-containing protein, partial [Candidatus Cryosericum sp.]|nr:helix-turn-helix domain-containing protein [Candidatus Cryosericum sp.]